MADTSTLAVLQQNGVSQETYWSKMLQEMIVLEMANFVFTNLGVQEVIPGNQGTTEFTARRYNSLPVDLDDTTLAEGVPPTALKVEAQKVTGSVDQMGAFIKTTDVATDVAFDDIAKIYQPELSRHAAEVIERNIIASFTDASEYFVGSGNTDVDGIADADVLTFQDVRLVALSMKNYNRKGHEKFGSLPVCVCHTNVIQDLLDDDVLEEKLMIPGNDNLPIKNGSLEKYKVYGIYFIETLIAEVEENSAQVNVYTSYLLGRRPYMILSLKSRGVQFFDSGFKATVTDPLAQLRTFGYKLWTGAKILDPLAITKIYSGSGYDVLADFTGDDIGRTASQAELSA